MKTFLRIIAIIFAAISLYALMIIFMMTGGGFSLAPYYSNKNNYDRLEGKITYIKITDDKDIYLYVETGNNNYDGNFNIEGNNVKAVLSKGFENEIQLGDTVILYSAYGYFGDGYTVPVTGFEKDGKVYIDFDTGVANQVAYEKVMHIQDVVIILVPIIIFKICFLIFFLTFNPIQIKRRKR